MKNETKKLLLPLLVTISLALTQGCLLPKKVEAFQDKVETLPTKTKSHVTYEKQAAQLLDTTLTSDGHAIAPVADTLSESLGPPKKPYPGTPAGLEARLEKAIAGYQGDIEKFRKKNDKNAGKAIEGTGIFQIGYFSYVGLLFLFVGICWIGIRIYGLVNPLVGFGSGAVQRMGAGLVRKGFGEVVDSFSSLEHKLSAEFSDPRIHKKLISLVRQSQRESQSRDTQEVIRRMKKG